MEANLAVLLAPDEADGQAAPQLAARRFIANAAIEPGAQHMQFGFRHRAF